MKDYLSRLRLRHKRIDRLIDTSKAYGKQEDVKILKRIRLRLRDTIAETKRSEASPPA